MEKFARVRAIAIIRLSRCSTVGAGDDREGLAGIEVAAGTVLTVWS
jgi:hypothetical protein